jgi:cytoskeletal protein CcmA (bactofilin family)
MPEKPRRRLLDRLTPHPTFVGAGTLFKGDIVADGDFVLAGRIIGDGSIAGALTIAADSTWQGHIGAGRAVIAGIVDGSLLVEDRLEIRKTARIRGPVRARHLAIAAGATVEGETSVTSENPIVHYEEKRSRE